MLPELAGESVLDAVALLLRQRDVVALELVGEVVLSEVSETSRSDGVGRSPDAS